MKLFFRIFVVLLALAAPAQAASVIRDSEIENVLKTITTPIFRAAKLSPDNVHLYVINDSQINAFVSGGQNIFVNTGLMMQSQDPLVLIGVLSHETGHIEGGHLTLSADEARSSTVKATLGYVLGIAAAAAGSPAAGQAIAAGGMQIAQRGMLKHTRTQEEAADLAAMRYLDTMGYSAKGLLELFHILYQKENTAYEKLNPYTQTHPLSRERIANMEDHINRSAYKNGPPENIQRSFSRAVTKLSAFLDNPEETLNHYPTSDQSVNAHYARAIAYYKIPEIQKSLEEMDILLKQYPNDPYFNELKGQILFENGRIAEAMPYYEKSHDLLPDDALLKIQLAGAQIAAENPKFLPSSITYLKQALTKEKENVFAWHQLAIAYGRDNQIGMSNLALAEEAALLGKKDDVKTFVKLARQYTKAGSPADLRLQDLLSSVMDKDKQIDTDNHKHKDKNKDKDDE